MQSDQSEKIDLLQSTFVSYEAIVSPALTSDLKGKESSIKLFTLDARIFWISPSAFGE